LRADLEGALVAEELAVDVPQVLEPVEDLMHAVHVVADREEEHCGE